MKTVKSAKALALIMISAVLATVFCLYGAKAQNFPFYGLRPSELVMRSSFFTSFYNSSEERKHNIKLAAEKLNGCLIDVNAEFSFNLTVGARTKENGFKTSKIIFDGRFIDGVGGGVCQVSSTLYNAALLAGLSITEFHAHSLPVSYIAPSFDAMVNGKSADLKFINNTYNPIIIYSFTEGDRIRIEIHGEPCDKKYVRKSVITEYLSLPKEEIIKDYKNEYPHLKKGERQVLFFGKSGFKSHGYLLELKDGKILKTKKIRQDTYNSMRGIIVEGFAENTENTDESVFPTAN